MSTIQRRIAELERKAGLDKEIRFIIIRTNIFGKPECPAFRNTDNCPRYQEFRRKPRVNDNGFAVFSFDCESCEGILKSEAGA